MPTLTRTWPYGAELDGEVLTIHQGRSKLYCSPAMVAVRTDDGEGHIMLHVRHAIRPQVGNRVTIRFEPGGQTGGFWRIVR